MHQVNHSIIERTNIQSDAVVINQCDNYKREEFFFKNSSSIDCKCLFISTTERGLSRSRNEAIKNATADICLLCDDDEILESDYAGKILGAFEEYNDDVIAFRLNHPTRKFKPESYEIGFLGAATVGSWQIAFRRKSIIDQAIKFNEKMGSGTGNGAGEENRFIIDCLKSGLKVRYVPKLIGTLKPDGESKWFNGYDNKYWINRGWQCKMIFGKFWGYLYLWYTIMKKKNDKGNSLLNIIKWMHHGYNLKR